MSCAQLRTSCSGNPHTAREQSLVAEQSSHSVSLFQIPNHLLTKVALVLKTTACVRAIIYHARSLAADWDMPIEVQCRDVIMVGQRKAVTLAVLQIR